MSSFAETLVYSGNKLSLFAGTRSLECLASLPRNDFVPDIRISHDFTPCHDKVVRWFINNSKIRSYNGYEKYSRTCTRIFQLNVLSFSFFFSLYMYILFFMVQNFRNHKINPTTLVLWKYEVIASEIQTPINISQFIVAVRSGIFTRSILKSLQAKLRVVLPKGYFGSQRKPVSRCLPRLN